MTNRLWIDRLEWDWWNLEHISKYDVTRDEVEEAVQSPALVKPSYKERFIVFGATSMGQMLAVVVGEVPGKPGFYYVFSARSANRKERRELRSELET